MGRVSFRRLTDGLVERLEVIVRFLALLELFKQGMVELDQGERFGDIEVEWTAGRDPVAVGVDHGRLRRLTAMMTTMVMTVTMTTSRGAR